MSNLVFEIALRLAKALASFVLGLVVYGIAISVFAASPSVELALLSWLSSAAFILLVETSPIG
jgi:hypothetical protein